jgi:DmsE family decaheme c-type cytochrome
MRVPRLSRQVTTVLISTLILWFGATASAATQDQKAKPATAKEGSYSAQYVGADNCKTCHEDQFKNVQGTAHYKAFAPKGRGQEWHGCESCHGPGSAHVDGGGDKTKIFRFSDAKPEEVTNQCMTCHQNNLEHQNFKRSTHNKNGVSCTSCHSAHVPQVKEKLLIKKSPDLCFTCHNETKADFMKPFRHRVLDGYIQCQDCHNVHGTIGEKSLRANAAQDAVCYKCHADKRGPFVFEHEPVRTQGCSSCHTPHGSTNARLLTRSRVNSLCLECHQNFYNPPHPQNTKSQACTMCHTAIHGSNSSEIFFKY